MLFLPLLIPWLAAVPLVILDGRRKRVAWLAVGAASQLTRPASAAIEQLPPGAHGEPGWGVPRHVLPSLAGRRARGSASPSSSSNVS